MEILYGLIGFLGVLILGVIVCLLTGGLKITLTRFEDSDDGRIHWRENFARYSSEPDGADKRAH